MTPSFLRISVYLPTPEIGGNHRKATGRPSDGGVDKFKKAFKVKEKECSKSQKAIWIASWILIVLAKPYFAESVPCGSRNGF